MSDVKTAIIVGGGIAGPVTALALRKIGVAAHVYEAHDGTADGVGGMLGLAPNGLDAFDAVGLGDVVRQAAEPVSTMAIQSWTGKTLAEFGDRSGPPFLRVIWRTDLYRLLQDALSTKDILVDYGKRLVTAENQGDFVTAVFADGTRVSADILVGADGIRSAVRSIIDPAAPKPRYTGLLGIAGNWRKGADLPSTNGSMNMTYGKRAFFAYRVDENGRAGWFANLPYRQPLTMAEARAVGGEEWLRRLRWIFADDRTPAPGILRHVRTGDLVVVGALEDLPRVPTWSRGRMVLVGDSAHATSPSSGQGASIAAESALQLARCLRDLPVTTAFGAYEQLRRERVERIIAAGARTSSGKAAGPVARVFRDLTMPAVMKVLARPERMAWQHGYHIDFDAAVAG
ncbi:FAD-dependent monooxygenase [Fodinicola acaciae]|uniref:FAD-dependent monooxygenase n=1 Tax=Fodinicola acaciae TaxID=2681555 RepID=UPI0013D704B6|nr:FAD-dependent monooxygenase [Fodinicola acaciae]